MMIPFLKQIAASYYRGGDIEDTCFIFPNRRSEVFFVKYLSDVVAEESRAGHSPVPLKVPCTITVNDFIYRLYGISPTDRVTLLLELYKAYSEVFPKAEPLDEFIFWGDIILGDFNDVDKYLADASQLFTNIADLKDIQDKYEYLSGRQRAAIESFVSHFRDGSGRLTVDLKSDNPKVKERFLQIWNILYPLYLSYRDRLSSEGLAYDGMVYRSVAEKFISGSPEAVLGDSFPYVRKFVFTGLNALNECEKTVMRKMKQASLAEFCWDYSGSLIRDRYNKSSFFMRENVREFPQAVDMEEDLPVPEIRVISVPSAIGQVKQLPGIFREIAREYTGGDLSGVGVLDGSGRGDRPAADCAVVLPDENLLMPVLNTVPPEIRDINVTMGYPITASSFFLFMTLVADVQSGMRKKGGTWYFYHKPVRTLFSDNIFRTAAGGEGRAFADEVKAAGKLFIPAEDLDKGGIFSAVFRPVVAGMQDSGPEVTDALASYMLDVIEAVVPALRKGGADKVEIEFAAEFHRTITALRRVGLDVKPRTWLSVLRQILSPVSVPFKGEPLQGLQIMGPLETRALDFENLVVLSANEGVFPRRSVSSSFIPPELRKGFGLPTYEYQDAVWAYYFYRMISRARNVWLLSDARTEGLKSGEESRYIRQLQYHFNIPLKRYAVTAALSESEAVDEIPKTDDDVRAMKEMSYSASSLEEYMICPVRFYYDKVKKLGKEDDVTEELDSGLFGTVYHEVMRCLYMGEEAMKTGKPARDWADEAPEGAVMSEVTEDWITGWLGRRNDIREKVRKIMLRELNTIEIAGKNLVTMDVVVRYVMKTLSADLELLGKSGNRKFRIVGLEKYFRTDFHGFRIHGVVDRIDSLDGNGIRVVDYKTGTVDDRELRALSGNPADAAKAVFSPRDGQKRPLVAFQLYVYDKFMAGDPSLSGYPVVNCIYSIRRLFRELPSGFPVGEDFIREMDAGLSGLLDEMTDVSIPFMRTKDTAACRYCDFKTICGR